MTTPEPKIRTRYIGNSTVAEWTCPWTGRKRWVTSDQGVRDAEAKAKADIRLEWQRREEDRLTYGGPRPSGKGVR